MLDAQHLLHFQVHLLHLLQDRILVLVNLLRQVVEDAENESAPNEVVVRLVGLQLHILARVVLGAVSIGTQLTLARACTALQGAGFSPLWHQIWRL